MGNKVQIKTVHFRTILNSHGEFTNEFIIFLENGSIGRGASSKAETISIYEDKHIDISPKTIIEVLKNDRMLHNEINQEDLDNYLEERMVFFGRNNCYAISLAFYDANEHPSQTNTIEASSIQNKFIPKLCINILNGGNHA